MSSTPPPLLSAQNLSKSFGGKPLFSSISIAIAERERVALIGPNGSGKSTLLRMLAQQLEPDSGQVRSKSGLRVAYVPQQDKFNEELSVRETLERVLHDAHRDEREVEAQLSRICGQIGFVDQSALVGTLSGGWRKRLAIASSLILEPELLLLDEPTNHLDIEGVFWLEETLLQLNCAIIFVTHDRYLIAQLAKRLVEINRRYPSGYFQAVGDYADFLEARANHLFGLQQNKDSLANKVRREVAWLRQGAKARTTKQKFRSDQALKLSDQLKSINIDERKVTFEFAASKRKTSDLIKVEHISKQFAEAPLFHDISLILTPGTRLGIVGANGSGKTTFIRTLLGELEPDKGHVQRASRLRTAFFDQARRQLDPSISLKAALCHEGDAVVFQGRSIHVVGWAERFLFTRDQLSLPVANLSGGEQARLLLARLMLEESDILFFDEPTNDLDINTLEILEQSFDEYPGAIVLITHDRYLLERCATSVLALGQLAGGLYADYMQWEVARSAALKERKVRSSKYEVEGPANANSEKKRTKLTFKEARELRSIEEDIVKAEKRASTIQAQISSDATVGSSATLAELCDNLAQEQARIEALYERWNELERIKASLP